MGLFSRGYYASEDFNVDDTPTMERIRHKRKLIKDTNDIFSDLAKAREIYPRGYYNKVTKSIKRDVYIGLREINKKNPVYIEMAKLVKVGNGQTKKIGDEENISVNVPVTSVVSNEQPLDLP